MNRQQPTLWEIADTLRNKGRFSLVEIIEQAQAQGIRPNSEELRALTGRSIRMDGRFGVFVPPAYLVEFIAGLLSDKNHAVKSLLNVAAGSGFLLQGLAAKLQPLRMVAIEQNVEAQAAGQWLTGDLPVEWRTDESVDALGDNNELFDTVVGLPPWGMPTKSTWFAAGDQHVEVHDDLAPVLLLAASLHLTDNGTAVFAMPPNFLLEKGEKRVVSRLDRFGLHITAVFRLVPGIFQPHTMQEGMLVVIRRHATDKLFIGEVSQDANQREALLRNFKTQKSSPVPQIGMLVARDTFKSFRQFYGKREVEDIALRSGLELVMWDEAITKINLAGKKGFSHHPDAVYLPALGTAPAVTALSDLTIKPKNYVQLIVNRECASAAYLAQFLNSSQGRTVREALQSGTFIPRITKASVAGARLPLPNLTTQTEVLSAHATLTDLISRVESLNRELWSRPSRYKDVQKQLKAMQPANSFENWLETLPFPIASILWAYQANSDVERKLEHLFFFFEALAEFLALVMLSGYAADQSLYAQESSGWIDNEPKYRNWIRKSDFGGWRILGARLANTTRRLRENKEKREILLQAFGHPSVDFLSMVTNKKLYQVLEQVNNFRNEWKGHSGVFSKKKRKEHLTLLEAQLSEIRSIMQDYWLSALVLKPGSSDYADGVYEYSVKALMGSRSQFKQVSVQTIRPMDKRNLYLLHEGQREPVELLPLIRLLASPEDEDNAVYFYNRAEKSETRWVSYHFEKESERFVDGDQQVLSKLSTLGFLLPEE